jgi:AraC-like DNA-binding protein
MTSDAFDNHCCALLFACLWIHCRMRWCRALVGAYGVVVKLSERIDELVAQHGSLRALARVMECSPPYICRLRAGVTKNPGQAVLRKLGLRRVVTYERVGK